MAECREERNITTIVEGVISSVRDQGDDALCEFASRWDGVRLTPKMLRVPSAAIGSASVDTEFAAAFRHAVDRIRKFHEQVKPRSVFVEDAADGVRLGLRWTPVRSVGLYVPGGKASYPSTLAMTAVPAQIAGVQRIAVVSPPGPNGEVSDQVLTAARILGLKEIYRVGGAQAVAALAIGTEAIPRVDKIFGPGNAFVAEAKKQLYGEVGIDMLAGPSEIVVYADHSAEPAWVAADLMAQAEHDEDTRITVLASSQVVLEAVTSAFERGIEDQPRRETIAAAWKNHGRAEVVADPATAAARIDEIAPEHLSLQVDEPWQTLTLIHNAGAIFLGPNSPVAMGDYYAGPNHVLPTGTTARFSSCLSVEDFMKRSNVCELNRDFLVQHGERVETLAHGEGLPAHANSVRLRRQPTAGPRARRGVRTVRGYDIVEEDAAVKLNQNESPWDLPEEIKDEVASRLRRLEWNRYHQKVPSEFLDRLAATDGVRPEQVIAASGSNLLLQWIFEAYAAPGAVVVCPRPSFSLYSLWAGVCECALREVEFGDGFAYEVEPFLARIRAHRPALTILCLPNNPTGSEMRTEDVVRIAREVGECGGVLVVDEAYRDFSGGEFDRTALCDRFDHVILLRTFSKAYAAAGVRLGYAVAPEGIISELRKVMPPFHLNLFAAVLGITVLERRGVFSRRIQDLLTERDDLIAALRALPTVEVVPTHANFFLVRVGGDAARVFAELKERDVLVRRVDPRQLGGEYLRVNVGTPDENRRLLAAVSEVIAGR